MPNEEKLTKQIQAYAELAKKDPNVNVSALMVNALKTPDEQSLSTKTKRWAYLVSVGFPPFGLLFALYFFLSDKDDAKEAAYACIALTAVAVLVLVITFKLLITGSGTNLQELEKVNPQDLRDLIQ